jgi:CRISPR/Cas system-associated protein Cas5 (RAMP superfamily)
MINTLLCLVVVVKNKIKNKKLLYIAACLKKKYKNVLINLRAVHYRSNLIQLT